MKTIEDKINALNELIQFNNDRINGYVKAAEETEVIDADLRLLFNKMANDSRSYRKELAAKVVQLGGEVITDGSVGASIHRAWMDFKAALTGSNRSAILSSCEFGENAIIEAYDAVLEETESYTADEIAVITQQRNGLRNAQSAITEYKKLNKVAN